MQAQPKLAIIGGTGLQAMPGLENIQTLEVETPFGKPSSPITVGELAGSAVAFLSRHGLGHHLTPSEVPYRANIYALKSLGVERIVSVSACGSLREDYSPGNIVIPDQIFDLSKGRPNSFFGEGLVAHIGVADPFCPDLSAQLFAAAKMRTPDVHKGGAYVTIEGPRFSTKRRIEYLPLVGHVDYRHDRLRPRPFWRAKPRCVTPPWRTSPIMTSGMSVKPRFRWRW